MSETGSVFENLPSKQQEDMLEGVRAALQTLADMDKRIFGEVSQSTLDAIQAQNFSLDSSGRVQRAEARQPQAWNGIDGLLNGKPFVPEASPKERANALIDLAESDIQRLGNGERRLIVEYAEAVDDNAKVIALVNHLCEQSYEMQHGHMDDFMKTQIESEIAVARAERTIARDPAAAAAGMTAEEYAASGYGLLDTPEGIAAGAYDLMQEYDPQYAQTRPDRARETADIAEGIHRGETTHLEMFLLDVQNGGSAPEEMRGQAEALLNSLEEWKRQNITYSIYQLKGGPEMREYLFKSYDRLQAAGLSVDQQNYTLVYTAPLDDLTTLEDIYRLFNADDRPADFTGRSLSVSDVVVLRRGRSQTAYYCDSFGFQEAPEFLRGAPTLESREEAEMEQESTAAGGISADDPAALDKLREKLAGLEKEHEKRKAVNDYFRQNGSLDGCPQLLRSEIEDLKSDMARSPLQRTPFDLNSSSAEIRRIRERISSLEKMKEAELPSWYFEGGRVEANKERMRLQIFFDSKPSEEIRSALKSHGFRWSPKEGAWQRKLTRDALSAAQQLDFLKPTEAPVPAKGPEREQGSAAGTGNREAKSRELEQKLFSGVQEIFRSEKFKEYLSFYSKFHSYSIKNCILIFSQMPDASLVAGYNKWKEKGRQVRKGEKGIVIFAPSTYKQKLQAAAVDENGKPVLDEKGEPVKTEITKEYIRFVPVSVFDISQTDGPELPSLIHELQGDAPDYSSILDSIRQAALPFSFSIGPIPGDGVKGFCNYFTQAIIVKEGMSEAQTVKTALHELAHSRLHASQEGEEKNRNQKEIEAESVAYLLANHFGLDTSSYSFAYVAEYAHGKEPEELLAILSNVSEAADKILNDLERFRALEIQKQEAEPEQGKILPFREQEKEKEAQALE